MSHVVTIETKVHDPVAVKAACQKLGLAAPTEGSAELFSGKVEGLIVKLPGWEYPIVIDHLAGSIKYDNYSGAWGEIGQMEKFLQRYAVEKAKIEARRRGYQVSEQ